MPRTGHLIILADLSCSLEASLFRNSDHVGVTTVLQKQMGNIPGYNCLPMVIVEPLTCQEAYICIM